eukprot:TRINITY_DN33651_c0_g1_i1.p1 TRINITY_DN33651_c0_g1~~TRINITY_DN33651_c0_g1_i1.p1  ORF type:complete len:436 (+),score=94.37 TRINITY_DN33651_c0_g1_i1:83-1390(+)
MTESQRTSVAGELDLDEKDILARRGYYDEMTHTFEELHGKRDVIHKHVVKMLEEKSEIVEKLADLNTELDEALVRDSNALRQKRKVDRILRKLEAGGSIARAMLRKLQLSKIRIEDRVATMREEYRSRALRDEGEVPSHVPNQDIEVTHHIMPGPGGKVPLRSYSPPAVAMCDRSPVIVFFHGEGYVTGDFETHDWLCRALASLAGVTVVATDYRRPPEVRFPGAFEDAYAAVCWVADGGLGSKPTAVAVAGDAAGGGLAAACCLRARADEKGPKITVQVLFYPWLDLRPVSQSMQSCNQDVEAHMLQQEELDFFSECYAPPREVHEPTEEEAEDNEEGIEVREWLQDERASPLLASSLKDLPQVFIAYAHDDLLATDSTLFADRLRQECGPDSVHMLELQGAGHGFAKHSHRAEAYAAVAAAGAFASAALRHKA